MVSCFEPSVEVDHKYTIAITEPGNGNSSILRGVAGEKGLFVPSDSMKTCFEIFQHGKRYNPDARCLGARTVAADGKLGNYSWLTYNQVERKVLDLGSGIVNLNLSPETIFNDESQQGGKFKFLCIYAKNRPEWHMLELACNTQRITVIPMYDTLGVDGLKFISSQASLVSICCSSVNLKNVIDASRAEGATIKNIVLFDTPSDEDKSAAAAAGLTIYTFAEVEASGAASPLPAQVGFAEVTLKE
jgi:long-chain acyl-CoA synthetase